MLQTQETHVAFTSARGETLLGYLKKHAVEMCVSSPPPQKVSVWRKWNDGLHFSTRLWGLQQKVQSEFR